MDFVRGNGTKIVGVVVVGVMIFIGAMVGTSLRKLSTEEGKCKFFSFHNSVKSELKFRNKPLSAMRELRIPLSRLV